MSLPQNNTRPAKTGRWLLLAVLVAGFLAAYGIIDRDRSNAELAQWTQQQAIPSVDLVTATHPTEGRRLTLPADIEAFYTAPIHARVSGYVSMWYFDIGAHVKTGDILAKIDTPDLDQQFAQAKGELAKAQADYDLARITSSRWQTMRLSLAVSQQTADEKAGDAVAKKAVVETAEANVQRIKAMEGFRNITAPFDGVVTARRIDVGALVSSSGNNEPGLFDVAAVDKMRVYVRMPQIYIAQVHKGMAVALKVPQFPGHVFKAVVTTTSSAISKQSHALLVELSVDNNDRFLSPGSYAQAQFDFPLDATSFVVPPRTVIFRNASPEVATVDAAGKVTLKPIAIALDLGTSVAIASGLDAADHIIASPSDSIATGDIVDVASLDGNPVAPAGPRLASSEPAR